MYLGSVTFTVFPTPLHLDQYMLDSTDIFTPFSTPVLVSYAKLHYSQSSFRQKHIDLEMDMA